MQSKYLFELIKQINEDYLIYKQHIYKILEKMRYIINHYLKDTY